jgi:hypothetical protein
MVAGSGSAVRVHSRGARSVSATVRTRRRTIHALRVAAFLIRGQSFSIQLVGVLVAFDGAPGGTLRAPAQPVAQDVPDMSEVVPYPGDGFDPSRCAAASINPGRTRAPAHPRTTRAGCIRSGRRRSSALAPGGPALTNASGPPCRHFLCQRCTFCREVFSNRAIWSCGSPTRTTPQRPTHRLHRGPPPPHHTLLDRRQQVVITHVRHLRSRTSVRFNPSRRFRSRNLAQQIQVVQVTWTIEQLFCP